MARFRSDCQKSLWLKWNPAVSASRPSVAAAAEERRAHPVWAASVWPLVLLIVCTERGTRRRRLADRLYIALHSGEAARASPSSSSWQLIPRLSNSVTGCAGRGEWQGRETCTLSRTDSAEKRHVNHQGYYCRAGRGTLQHCETPHWLLH